MKEVILLSGGLDSTVLLYNRMFSGSDCYPLTINYGQRHEKEVYAARNICERLGLISRWKYVNLGPQISSLLPSSLTGVGNIPEGHYEDETMKSTVVPNRNMILLAIAAGYAQGVGAQHVLYAAHTGDHAIYPDCRPEFVDAVTKAAKLGTGWNNDGVDIIAPFTLFSKKDIVYAGHTLRVPFELTWSCYNGRNLHCGKCGTCVERKEAFKLAGVPDLTLYEA